MQKLTEAQFKKQYGEAGLKAFAEPLTKTTYGSRLVDNVSSDINTRVDKVGDILNRKDTGIVTKGVQVFGQGAGMAANVLEQTVNQIPGVSKVTGAIGSGINWLATSKYSPIKYVGDVVGNSKKLQEVTQLYDTDPNFKDTVDAVANIARLGMDVKGAVDSAVFTKNVTSKIASKVAGGVDDGLGGLTRLTEAGANKISELTSGIRDVAKPIIEEIKTIPAKARTNVAQIRATEATLKTLPKAGETAVRSGVDLSDVKELYKMSKTVSPQYKKLVKVTQDFASGKSKTNPFEVVGKPIVQGLKKAQSNATKIGSELSSVADNLPNFSPANLKQGVFNGLKKVRGLEGLEITPKGQLNFRNTTLATAATKADRVAIQKIFNDAVKNSSAKSKHLLRQELFEVLGGKKKAGVQLTGTQEAAYEAVRKSLADALDNISPTYKALNMKYAKAISPIQKLQKLLGSAGADEDILNMKAGLLARRITSFSKSNPEIRQILRDLDSSIASKGKTLLKTEQLQDFYNILDKYYDIAGKTGFQGQVETGVTKALSKTGASKLVDMVEGQVKGVIGETEIVKQKALEQILKEILK